MGWSKKARQNSIRARQQRQAELDQRVGLRIQALRSQGYTWRTVADKLNAEEARAPRGGPWSEAQVARIAQRMEAQRMELQKMEIKRMENQRGTTQRFIPSLENEVAASRKTAERGDAQGQYDLGLIYAAGLGVSQNLAKAATLFRKAAEQGHALAQANLGLLYCYGRGVDQDDAEAVRWFRKAAEQGNTRGQFSLGVAYLEGQGVPQDDAEAVKWFRKAAEQDHFLPRYEEQKDIALTPINLSVLEARVNLGVMYLDGRGVPQDDAEAVRWWRKAADPGDVKAQCKLGIMYLKGRGVPQDDAQAAKWFRKAAEQGYVLAQHSLGIMCEAAQDGIQAYVWFDVAATQGHTKSAELRGRVAERLTSEERARAQKMAGDYWKLYVLPFRRNAR